MTSQTGRHPDRPFDAVWFDCDSTLCTIEGIDELALARPREIRERIAAATDRAMDGDVPLESVYRERLDLLRPTLAELDRLGARYVETLVPGAAETIAGLAALGKRVGIISGGLAHAVRHVAARLGVAAEQVHAVELLHDEAGDYVDFVAGPLTRSGGKVEVLRALFARCERAERNAFVGDGVTDLETRDLVDRFVGFGGVVRRARVERESAPHYCLDRDLRATGALLLTADELADWDRWQGN